MAESFEQRLQQFRAKEAAEAIQREKDEALWRQAEAEKQERALVLGREIVALLTSKGIPDRVMWKLEPTGRTERIPAGRISSGDIRIYQRYTQAGRGWPICAITDIGTNASGFDDENDLYGIDTAANVFLFDRKGGGRLEEGSYEPPKGSMFLRGYLHAESALRVLESLNTPFYVNKLLKGEEPFPPFRR